MALLALVLHLALTVTHPAAPPARAPSPEAGAVEQDAASPPPGSTVRASEVGPRAIAPAALAPPLHAMTLAPQQLDPGPFRAGEVLGATFGAFAGDALVLALGYETLQLFAHGTLSPTATNFRRAMYGLGAAALVLPPLTAVLLAKLGGGPNTSGALWKAMLLASVGQAVALAAGYYAAPRFWVVLPVQAITLSLGATLGLHWGPARARTSDVPDMTAPDAGRDGADPRPTKTAGVAAMPLCTES